MSVSERSNKVEPPIAKQITYYFSNVCLDRFNNDLIVLWLDLSNRLLILFRFETLKKSVENVKKNLTSLVKRRLNAICTEMNVTIERPVSL